MLSEDGARDDGFTLIELVMTIAIVAMIVTALAGVIIVYLRTATSAQTRMNESHDVQLAAAYFQQDFNSVGVHGFVAGAAGTGQSGPFPTQQSVWTTAEPAGVPASCSGLAGAVVGFVWNDYSTATVDSTTGAWSGWTTDAVVYTATSAGSNYTLQRTRCVGSATATTITLANSLAAVPSVSCAGVGCNDTSGAVPTALTMTLQVADNSQGPTSTTGYTATLTADRRQS